MMPSTTLIHPTYARPRDEERFSERMRGTLNRSLPTLAQPALSLGSRRRNTAPPPFALSAVSSPP
jgi:hypothetical protein